MKKNFENAQAHLIISKREINRDFGTDLMALYFGISTLATSCLFLTSGLNLTSNNLNPALAFMGMLGGITTGLMSIIFYKGFKIFSENAKLLNYYSHILNDTKIAIDKKIKREKNSENTVDELSR